MGRSKISNGLVNKAKSSLGLIALSGCFIPKQITVASCGLVKVEDVLVRLGDGRVEVSPAFSSWEPLA